MISSWQLQIPITAVVFDCDGTVSAIEGVNELAKNNGTYETVEAITTKAMSVSGINPKIYQERLELIYPNYREVLTLAEDYFIHQVPDVGDVIKLFQRLNKAVYLVSAGVNPAVKLFGERLSILREHIYAVDIQFDPAGNYLNFDHASPLVHSHGKRDIVNQLKTIHPRIIHIGDGLNDYCTHDMVTRFIGYGGVFYREQLASLCQYYIRTPSLAALLPLCLTLDEVNSLNHAEQVLYNKGIEAIEQQFVKI